MRKFSLANTHWQWNRSSSILNIPSPDKGERLFLIMNARTSLFHDFWRCLGLRFNPERGERGRGGTKCTLVAMSGCHLWTPQHLLHHSILRLHVPWHFQGLNHFKLLMVTPPKSLRARFSSRWGHPRAHRALTMGHSPARSPLCMPKWAEVPSREGIPAKFK